MDTKALNQAAALMTGSTTSQIQTVTQNVSLNLKNRDSINALDFIGGKVTSEDILKAEEFLKMNFGVDYPKEKFSMLWEMIREEGWTSERLKQTLKNFLKTKKFATWTIADWFDYKIELYGYSEYLKKLNERGKTFNNEIEWYRVGGVPFWKYKDVTELPLERINN